MDGNEFPFSRGASFYEVSSQGQILYGRDLVEPALKPGSSALLVSLPSCCFHFLPGRTRPNTYVMIWLDLAEPLNELDCVCRASSCWRLSYASSAPTPTQQS